MLGIYSEAIGHNFPEVFSEAFGGITLEELCPRW